MTKRALISGKWCRHCHWWGDHHSADHGGTYVTYRAGRSAGKKLHALVLNGDWWSSICGVTPIHPLDQDFNATQNDACGRCIALRSLRYRTP